MLADRLAPTLWAAFDKPSTTISLPHWLPMRSAKSVKHCEMSVSERCDGR